MICLQFIWHSFFALCISGIGIRKKDIVPISDKSVIIGVLSNGSVGFLCGTMSMLRIEFDVKFVYLTEGKKVMKFYTSWAEDCRTLSGKMGFAGQAYEDDWAFFVPDIACPVALGIHVYSPEQVVPDLQNS